MRYLSTLLVIFVCSCCKAQNHTKSFILVLGITQDGGYPHLGCYKQCCKKAWDNASIKKNVVSLALVDSVSNKWWLIEATPDIKEQLHYFQTLTNCKYKYLPDGIFITHAHIGHYSGLMQLGREVLGAKELPVYVMPRMKSYLETNGPWSQLVSLNNIVLHTLQNKQASIPINGISIIPYFVPHRDEYSETVGYKIYTSNKSYLFIPDINKWDKWEKKIVDEVKSVDIAFIDATFYDEKELPGKRMTEVPHPFVAETLQLFESTNQEIKKKIHFIHLNHTNPLLWDKAKQKALKQKGFNIAIQGYSY